MEAPSAPSEPGRSCVAFYDLASEVTVSLTYCQIEREGTDLTSQWQENQNHSVREEHMGWEVMVEHVFGMYSKYITMTLPAVPQLLVLSWPPGSAL